MTAIVLYCYKFSAKSARGEYVLLRNYWITFGICESTLQFLA